MLFKVLTSRAAVGLPSLATPILRCGSDGIERGLHLPLASGSVHAFLLCRCAARWLVSVVAVIGWCGGGGVVLGRSNPILTPN
eukprot:scaffold145643_cov26-Tisochrysis_lutea.AAC.1